MQENISVKCLKKFNYPLISSMPFMTFPNTIGRDYLVVSMQQVKVWVIAEPSFNQTEIIIRNWERNENLLPEFFIKHFITKYSTMV